MAYTQYYTIPTVAKMVDRSPWTIRRWIARGRLGLVQKIEGHWYVSHAALRKLFPMIDEAKPAEPIISARNRGELKRKHNHHHQPKE